MLFLKFDMQHWGPPARAIVLPSAGVQMECVNFKGLASGPHMAGSFELRGPDVRCVVVYIVQLYIKTDGAL